MVKQTNNQPAYCRNFLHSEDPASLSKQCGGMSFEDSRGRIWIGTTDKGLNLFNKQDGTFTVFGQRERTGHPTPLKAYLKMTTAFYGSAQAKA